MRKLFAAALMPALLIGCSDANKQHPNNQPGFFGGLFSDLQDAPALTIQSIDGQAIANAQVLIGDALNSPFAGNFLTTDQNGQIILPAGWTTPANITVQAPGFVRVTYMNQNPESLTIKMRAATTRQQYEIKGTAQQLPVEDKDGYIDFGLVMPAFSKMDLMAFNITNVISPQIDRISVYGQNVDIPANISLPKQSEKYGLFTVTLEKPAYRIYASQQGIQRVFAARGRFAFKGVLEDLKNGKEFYDVINDIRINGGGIRDIDVRTGQTKLDVPTRELNFTEKKEVAAPTFRSDEIFMAVGVANQSGYLIPTDVKKIESGKKLAVNALPGADQMVLGVLMKESEMKGEKAGGRMSAALSPFTQGVSPKMLPLIADPSMQNGELLFPKFNTVEGVNPIATYTVFSKEEEVQQGNAKVKLMNPQWEIYASDWQERMRLPQWPNETPVSGKKRWEVSFIGSQTASQAALGPAIIEAATHVTHSSVSF